LPELPPWSRPTMSAVSARKSQHAPWAIRRSGWPKPKRCCGQVG
jgi:hypothetical protein